MPTAVPLTLLHQTPPTLAYGLGSQIEGNLPRPSSWEAPSTIYILQHKKITIRTWTIHIVRLALRFGAHLGSHPGLGPVHFMRDSSGVCLGGISGGDNDSADMEIGIDSVGEALYAELDRESVQSGTNPSYQNTAYSQCGEVR